jgi:hypothetical protein
VTSATTVNLVGFTVESAKFHDSKKTQKGVSIKIAEYEEKFVGRIVCANLTA